MAEPTEVVSEGYRWGLAGAIILFILRALLPKGYRLRFIRLYAERDDAARAKATTDDDDAEEATDDETT